VTSSDVFALSPLIALAATAVLVMLGIAVYRDHLLTAFLTLLGLVSAFFLILITTSADSHQVTSLIIIDGYARFYMGLIFAASFAVAVQSYGYLKQRAGQHEEFYVLLLLATLGSAVLVVSSHFASFFLGLEILSVALYAMIAYPRVNGPSIEAGVKYLVLAAASAGFLLFGMALIYAYTGTMEFARMASLMASTLDLGNVMLLAGFAMLIVGIGFKLALVPFHMWTPDVYEGAPAPVTGFIATVSKGGMFALLLRYFAQIDLHAFDSLVIVFGVIAIATILVGNLLALLQNNVKRILAYSSISHFGYLLVAFLANSAYGVTAVSFYLVAFFVTELGAFGVVSTLSGSERDADKMDDYRGLALNQPWLAAIMTGCVLSLAGIPLTAGFVGKYFVLSAGADAALWALVIVLVTGSAIGLYYYLRIVVAMFMQPEPAQAERTTLPGASLAGSLVLAAQLLLLVWLGVYPTPLLDTIQTTVSGLL
jgi:NADH-quinone oxidoreductase subunit N